MNKTNSMVTSLKAIFLFTIILGIIFPLVITLIGQVLFYEKATGSLIHKDDKVVGSTLISQNFEKDEYFTSRPSGINYNPIPSGGSNLSPTDVRLKNDYEARKKLFQKKNYINIDISIPSEMLFASASGIDPHISKNSALLQLNRVALKRNLDEIRKAEIEKLIDSLSHKLIFGIMGNEYVNVLELNLKLDEMKR